MSVPDFGFLAPSEVQRICIQAHIASNLRHVGRS